MLNGNDTGGITLGTTGTITYGSSTANIERLLERIADALDRIAPAKDERSVCAFCDLRCEDEFYDHLGYGTKYDGKIICSGCIEKALEGLKK